jgi:hypothetical protein
VVVVDDVELGDAVVVGSTNGTVVEVVDGARQGLVGSGGEAAADGASGETVTVITNPAASTATARPNTARIGRSYRCDFERFTSPNAHEASASSTSHRN